MAPSETWTPATAGPLPWDRVPKPAKALLKGDAYKLLATLLDLRRGNDPEVEAMDVDLAGILGWSISKVQRLFREELVPGGWIERRRPRGRRMIAILFDLKGRPQDVHPLLKSEQCAGQIQPAHCSDSTSALPIRSRSKKTGTDSPRAGACEAEPGPDLDSRSRPEPPAAVAPEPEPRTLAAIGTIPPPNPAPAIAAPAEPMDGAWARLRARLGIHPAEGPEGPETPQPPAQEPAETPEPVRPARPRSRPRHVAACPPEPAPEERTAGQREFVDGLGTERRGRFDAWPTTKRAEVLSYFTNGLDPICLRDVLGQLDAEAPVAAPPPDTPTPELIRALSGPPAVALQLAPLCPARIMNDLGDKGAASFATWDMYCRQITAGVRDPESLAAPLERILEAKASGKPVRNWGSFLNASVQNWDREHPPDDPRAKRAAAGHRPRVPAAAPSVLTPSRETLR